MNYKIGEEARLRLIEWGVPVNKVNNWKIGHAVGRWGKCTKIGNGYEIEINAKLLDIGGDEMMTTVYHELIHTVNGCMNHGNEWKKWAKIVNDKTGLNIKRCTSYEEKGIERTGKYILECENCGYKYYKQRMCYSVQHVDRCRCGICKGKLKLV